MVFMLLCTVLVMLMVFGLSLFYSGLTQRRSALTMLALPWLIFPIIAVEWFVMGYTLLYSTNNNLHFIGNFYFSCFRHMENRFFNPNSNSVADALFGGTVHAYSHALFTLLFKLTTASVTFPVVAERGRLLPLVVFVIVWAIVIYNPVVYWYWNANGWLKRLQALDFAGGNPVHTMSGVVAFTYSYMLGPRATDTLTHYRSSSTGFLTIGTIFCIIGWTGFVGGCSFNISLQTLMLVINLLNSGCVAGATWLTIDYIISGKLSIVGFCSGLISGLVVVTPAAGYINFWLSFIFGILGGLVCNFATRIKFWMRIDDTLDIFAIHGVGGLLGSLLTGIFASKRVARLNGVADIAGGIAGGWIDRHYLQLAYQLASCAATVGYVFCVTFMALWLINRVPGLYLRISVKQEAQGTDELYFGEYIQDFIEFLRVLSPDDYETEPMGLQHVELGQHESGSIHTPAAGGMAGYFDQILPHTDETFMMTEMKPNEPL
ncbi:hypothetical protein BABINDRAFT_160143 [Babjeviella inositovora NRRL Y-12698]|uniref:Ammonium transporter AmtB-like domain-containing protein n=1 Tax=Babjeviella inositovora NRRL Y-12698 TaxID=984486 RepID=A0A1E3QW63_9ASCO|nr:uncharacterized protein BABINDRAFT_160143 [Babjeviella inositovora NRRL Y-12698]ODQ81916.1 hypothetical protein BABINDRAFT_160143 [Babjeviella inositovora NRRL Y-12698]